MSYTRPVFSDIRQRCNYLLGDETATTSATLDSSINQSVNDYIQVFPFSWDMTSTTGNLTTGTFTLPTNYIPKWGLYDVRIVNSSTNDDNIFDQIDPRDRDKYDSTTFKYWITSSAAGVYTFNSTCQSGTVTYYYYYFPSPMVNASDACLITDVEAVSLLAASKHWINDERNQALSHDYEDKATGRIKDAYAQDLDNNQGTFLQEGLTGMNRALTRR